jgi:hypothetical protein
VERGQAELWELVGVATAPLPGGWLGQQLQRLQRLQLLRDAHAPQLNEEGRRLLDHAIFTTFVDCRELGAESLAAAMLSPVGGPPGAPGGEAETEAGSGASDA